MQIAQSMPQGAISVVRNGFTAIYEGGFPIVKICGFESGGAILQDTGENYPGQTKSRALFFRFLSRHNFLSELFQNVFITIFRRDNIDFHG
jgi:hypothetical protein